MNEIPVTTDELKKLNPQVLPKLASDFSHSSFWQYTRLENADLILSSGSFRVGSIIGMNDLDELTLHDSEKKRIFALCFCNSNTEKIPMWYLYSGLAGNGAAIGITPSKMMKWINGITEVLGVKHGESKDQGTPLSIGKDVTLKWGWVYYQKTQERDHIMYRNKWYKVDDADGFQKDNYFIKSYPWEYEKEFRLIFINNTNVEYEAVFVNIPQDILDSIKVRLAPELNAANFNNYTGLKYIGSTKTPEYSKLSIRMNLLYRNRDSLLKYIGEELVKTNPALEVGQVCSVIKSAGKCNNP